MYESAAMCQGLLGVFDYLPFGEILSSDSNVSTHKFTGRVSGFVLANPEGDQERDSESGNDYFGGRYYPIDSAAGSPPTGLPSPTPTSPTPKPSISTPWSQTTPKPSPTSTAINVNQRSTQEFPAALIASCSYLLF